jgi:hypothetical protein
LQFGKVAFDIDQYGGVTLFTYLCRYLTQLSLQLGDDMVGMNASLDRLLQFFGGGRDDDLVFPVASSISRK